MTQITHPAVTKYDLALLFTLIVLIDDRMGDLEPSTRPASATTRPTSSPASRS